ncbi:MAG: reverse transcriptase/maturase family protein [Oscillospiraceae bacterium]|nr:reverse transcriptase/maturase family protein [Oscillospiraceae bacterium]
MSVLDNVYDQICEFSWLYDSYICARKRKRFRGDVMAFTDDLEHNLFDIQDDLVNLTYEGGPYHRFYVKEPKLRLVMSLQFRDRIVQWAVYRLLNPFYDKMFIEDSYACRIGKGSHRAAARLQYWLDQVSRKPGKWYYLKLDISKYFYRVDHAVLLEILSRRIKDERLYNLLEKIINNGNEKFGLPPGCAPEDVEPEMWLDDVGMPIGNLTSQLFANVYLNELDQYCKHKLRLHYYIRYMDDVIILLDSKEKLHEIKQELEAFLNDVLHLSLNNKTTVRPCAMGIEFVGYRIFADHKKLKHKTARRMIRSVKNLSYRLAAGDISRRYFDRVCASFKGLLDHCDSYGLRRKLNLVYLEQKIMHFYRSRDGNDETANYIPAMVACQ